MKLCSNMIGVHSVTFVHDIVVSVVDNFGSLFCLNLCRQRSFTAFVPRFGDGACVNGSTVLLTYLGLRAMNLWSI